MSSEHTEDEELVYKCLGRDVSGHIQTVEVGLVT